jgi:hypothetical protein
MGRTFVCAVAVTLATVCVATGEEFTAYILKVENGRVTFARYKFNKEEKKVEKGEPVTLPAATNIKVGKARFNKDTKKAEVGDPFPDGLNNELFRQLGENGLLARIETDADQRRVLSIAVSSFGKKKPK